VYREKSLRTNAEGESCLKQALRSRVTWIAAVFLFGYVGAGGALGGWIVTFMRRERGGGDFESGIVATGFWTGIAAGRLVLSFITPKLGEKLAVLVRSRSDSKLHKLIVRQIYIVIAIICQLMFWLVPSFHVSAVFVALQGFFLGPLFPAVIVAATKALPPHLHVSAIGFAAAIGVGGGAALPFAIGSLAQAKGLGVLQPIILAVLAALLVLWLCFPKMEKRKTEGEVPPPPPEERRKRWLNVDIDLVETIRRVVMRASGGQMVATS